MKKQFAKLLQKNKKSKLHKKMLEKQKEQVIQKQKSQIYLVSRKNMPMLRFKIWEEKVCKFMTQQIA